MKKIFLFLILSTLLFLQINTLSAVMATPELIVKEQPDGSVISFYLRGDEKIHWIESLDGYTMMYNRNGYIVYAMLNENGDMLPSDIIASNEKSNKTTESLFFKGIRKNLFYSESQVNTMVQFWDMRETETKRANLLGKSEIKTLCVLMNSQDKIFVKTLEDFEPLLNQIGYNSNGSKGSVKDFYLENSYGQINMTVTVLGPFTASKDMSYYVAGGDMTYVPELAKEAVLAIDGEIDFNDYDNDKDGNLDAFHFIFAGHGAEAGSNLYNSIWSHKWDFQPPFSLDGVKFSVYSCSPELRDRSGNNLTTIGVIAHEMCHVFGSPDYYDTDYEGSDGSYEGTGSWDLMAGGSWNGSPGGGRPAHINMHQKIAMGWVTPIRLDEYTEVLGMENSAENPVAYIYGNIPGEHFIIENRQKIGFDASIPGHGLLIYHIHSLATGTKVDNRKHPQQVYPMCASSSYITPTSAVNSYGSINSAGCPFPGTSNKTEFSDTSTPSSLKWNESETCRPITEIEEVGQLISFKFMDGISYDPVVDFKANLDLETKDVTLTWGILEQGGVEKYNIYKNGVFLKSTTENTCTQKNVAVGSYEYCVEVCYVESPCAVSARRCVAVRVPSSVAKLRSLVVEGFDLNPTFSANTLNYSVNVPLGTETITIAATSQNDMATITGTVTDYPLPQEKDTTFEVLVMAEDSTASMLYKVLVIVEKVSVDEVTTEKPDVVLYPNPAHDMVSVEIRNLQGNANVIVYNITGKQILPEQTISGNKTSLPIHSLPSGMYFLKVSTSQGTITKKMIIN